MPIPTTQYNPNAFYQGADFVRQNRMQDTQLQRLYAQDQRQVAIDERNKVVQGREDQQYEDEMTDREREQITKFHAPFAQAALKSGNPKQFYAQQFANPQIAKMLTEGGIFEPSDLDDPEFDQHVEALAAWGQQPEAKQQQIGNVQPGDYTPESLAAYEKSRNFSDLRRYVSPQQQGGGNAPSGYRFTPQGSLSAIPGGPADPNTKSTKDDSRTFAKADKLRDEFNAQSKEFVTVGDSYNLVQSVAADPSAAGDLSLIFAYMKMLDPNSVVREQEFANAQNAAGVPDRVRNAYNKALNGERLNPEQRKDFIGQAGNLYKTRQARQNVMTKRYSEIAKRNGVDPNDVVGDMTVLMETPAAGGSAPTQPQAPTATGPNGQRLILQNGKWVPLGR